MAKSKPIKDEENKKYGIFGSISLFFAERPRFTALLMLGIIGFGFLSYTNLIRREGFPSINLPIAIVQGIYPVDNSDLVDKQVAQPLEGTISQISDVESVDTNSSAFGASVVAMLAEGSNLEVINDELNQAIEDAGLPKMPRF